MTATSRANLSPLGSGRLSPVDRNRDAADRFGSRAQTLTVITFDLTDATELIEKRLTGNVIWAIDATSNSAALTVRFNEQSGAGIDFKKGMFFKGIAFDRLYISNAAQSGATITIVVAVEGDQLIDIVNPAEALSTITLTKATVLDSIADVSLIKNTTTQIVAASGTRQEVIIHNLAANADTFRIGDSGAVAANGIPLTPGQTLILSTAGAVHGFNPSVTDDQSVAVTELKD